MINGQDLRGLLLAKWGFSYDVQLRQVKGRVFFQVMWKYLEQISFPLSEEDYLARLERICQYLNAWDGGQQVRSFIAMTSERPRLGKAVSCPLDLGARVSEWLIID